ncbi:MAG: cation:proton antiporter, partial [Patescibacteria group bacterium]
GVIFGNLLPRFIDRSFLQLIADSGVALLLFTLGVEFSFHRLRRTLGAVVWAAVAQMLLTIFIFLLVLLVFDISFLAALFLSTAISLSSTAVVVKLLSERGELATLPGEVATAWLVIQDLAVVPLMVLLPTLTRIEVGSTGVISIVGTVFLGLVKAALLVLIVVLLGRFGIPRLLNRVAALGQREMFLLSTVGLVFLAAVTFYALGLSAGLGAFIAGLLVAETSQNHAIFAEVRPLRDLFVVVFFITLGMVLPAEFLWRQGGLLLSLTTAIIVFKWFLVFGLARFLGYHRKTAFLVAVSLTQMSEFGFILAQEGVHIGALSGETYVFLVALVFATIFASTPLVTHGHSLYYAFYHTLGRWWPKIFREALPLTPTGEQLPMSDHIVICGYGRVGKYIGRALSMANIPYVVIDYNQHTISGLKEKGIPVVYGDPADKDVLDYAQVDLARAMIIAIPDRHTQEMIIANTQSLNRRIRIICRTHHEEDQRHLKALGVHTLVQPEFEASLSIVTRLLTDFGLPGEEIAGKISRLKIEHGLG